MKSVRMAGNGAIQIVEVPEPSPGPNDVVVQTAASALCGSELRAYRGAGQERGNSGHEAAGTVLAVGPGVTRVRPGQRVGISAVFGCGECVYCARGQYTWCARKGFQGSMHAEKFLSHERACHVLPEDVSWDAGVLLSGDGFGVPYHSSTKIAAADIRTVAVFGAGPIGLGSILLQSWLGRKVLAIDVVPYRLELAKKLGASHAVQADAGDVVDAVLKWTQGVGVDAAIEAAGRPATAKQCFRVVRPGGHVVFNGEQPAVELSPSEDFIRRDITASGAWYYHFSEFGAMLALARQGLRIEELVTHRFPLGEAEKAFHLFSSGQTGKVILRGLV